MTKQITYVFRRASVLLVVAVQLLSPVAFINLGRVHADEASASPVATAPSAGEEAPTGADAKTYTYNTETKLWENDYYTWNPITKQTKPKSTPAYSWNPTTKR